jgi:hypothetical protein
MDAPACGIDVSERRGQQVCVLRVAADGALVPEFPAPAGVREAADAVAALGPRATVAVDAPSGGHLGLLAAGRPLRARLGLPDAGPFEGRRVCDALLVRRGLSLHPVPPAGVAPTGWLSWMQTGFDLFAALAARGLPLLRPEAPGGVVEGRAQATGRAAETYPDAVFRGLIGARPRPKRTREGRAARVGALRRAGVHDPLLDRRTLDELDACAAALVAHALARGRATWLGDPAEGVLVLL